MKRITSLLLSLVMLFTLCSPTSAAALDVTDEGSLSDHDAQESSENLVQASPFPLKNGSCEFYISDSTIAYFQSFDEAWKAVVVDGKFSYGGKLIVGEGGRVPLPDTYKFVMSKSQTVTAQELTVNDGVTVNIVVAPFTSGGAPRPTDITHTFNSGITVKDGGSLNFVSDMRGSYPENVTVTFGGPIKVENGGSLTMESVDPTVNSNSTVYQLSEEAEGSLLEVEAGGNATLTEVKLTSNGAASVISASGNVTLKNGIFGTKVTEVSNTGAAPAIEVKGAGQLTVIADDEDYDGQLAISSAGNGQPAIKVEENASLTLPKNPDAKITSGNNGGKAVDLAPGANVQQGDNTITVASVEDEPASNYVDNHGNIVLQSGSKDGKVAPNTVIQPDGTAITGKDTLPSVDETGSVTIPAGGATITNPEGDKVEVGSDTKIPSIVIGVKDNTGKVETSRTIELSSGALTLETVAFSNEINLSEYNCAVTSSNTNVATVSTAPDENGKIVVTPVGTGTAVITATYTKKNSTAEGVALLGDGDTAGNGTLTATFTVYVYKESSGGDSSSDDSDPTYNVALPGKVTGGSVKVSPRNAEKGETVTITVTPDDGYELDQLTVTDRKGNELDLTDKGNGRFTFKMPASRVEIEASFKLIEAEPETPVFADVPANAYYADAVAWAVEQGVTTGTSTNTFSPDLSCTRAQMVTFLWRANGSPKADGANPFTDVSADAYYYDAVLWAVKQGITSGTSATTFAPDMTVTRSQTVTFLYRAAGTPAVSGGSFADVAADAYYADAVAWAVKEGVTSGTGGNSFSPDAPCTRGQIVTFLYRAQ